MKKSKYISGGVVNTTAIEVDVSCGTLDPAEAVALVSALFGPEVARPRIEDANWPCSVGLDIQTFDDTDI